MKKVIIVLLLSWFQYNLRAQIIPIDPGSPMRMYSAKTFDIYPIADTEVEAIGINGGTKDVVPYDFYAAFNCNVAHPIDTVFYAQGDSLHMEVECTRPCFVIIVGMAQWGQQGNVNLFDISTYSNGLYRATIDFENPSCDILNRIIVVSAEYVLQKAVDAQLPITPPILVENNSYNSSGANLLMQTVTPYCRVDISDAAYNINSHIEGSVTGSNVYLLQGQVNANIYYNYQNAQLPREPYTIFTKNSTTDAELFIINSDNELVAHNDNYSVASDYDWGTEARVNLSGNDSLKAIVVVPHRNYFDQVEDFIDAVIDGVDYVFHDSTPAGTTDLYIGCKYYSYDTLFFPNLREYDALLSDPVRHSGICFGYNCFAWALGYYSYYAHHNYGGMGTAEGLAYYYSQEGYTTEGATEDNSEIDIWENNGECTHASIRSYTNGRSYGYDWESKGGLFYGRFMHPRYALTNDAPYVYEGYADLPYGHVVLHMIKNPTYVNREVVYENIDFTDSEIEKMAQILKSTSMREMDSFEAKYMKMDDAIRHSHINNPELLKKHVVEYKELMDLCQSSSAELCSVMQKLSMGDILAAYLILDMKLADKEAEAKLQKMEVPKAQIDTATQRIVRPDISEATLYAKTLLSELGTKTPQKNVENDIHYSNQIDCFAVKVVNDKLDVKFQLNRQSTVTLIVSRQDGYYSKILIDQKEFQSGDYKIETEVFEKGLYAVTLIVNGHIYAKKLSIR